MNFYLNKFSLSRNTERVWQSWHRARSRGFALRACILGVSLHFIFLRQRRSYHRGTEGNAPKLKR